MHDQRDDNTPARAPALRGLGPGLIVVYCLTIGLLYTLFSGFQFGAPDAVAHLPLILREMKPGCCPGDIFIEANQAFSPRRYYVEAIAAAAQVIPLPALYFVGAVVSNSLIALITFLLVRDLTGDSALAPVIACSIVFAVASISPGHAAQLHYNTLVPSALAKPLALLALWAILRERFFIAALASAIACLLHPLIGLVTGLVALSGAGAAWVYELAANPEGRAAAAKNLARIAGAVGGLGLVAWLAWFRHYDEALVAPEQFVDILGRLRAPALYIPSAFPPIRILDTVMFFVAGAITLVWYLRERPERRMLVRVVAVVSVIVAAMQIGGYLFVEVYPTRQWTALQAARFLFIPKWLGISLIAATIARLWRRENGTAGGWMMLMANGILHGTGLLVGHIAAMLSRRFEQANLRRYLPMVIGVAFVAASGLVAWQGSASEVRLLLLFAGFSFLLLYLTQPWQRMGLSVAVVVVVAGVIAVNARHQLPIWGQELAAASPTFDFEQEHAEYADVAQWARANTSEDAQFVGPPDAGPFRYMARRALVVDFTCIPFGDRGMLQWYERIQECYAPFTGGGGGAREQMKENWRNVDDGRLQTIAREFGADYAILYPKTQTGLEVVYEGPSYKVARLVAGGA